MRVLITGARGQLGRALVEAAEQRGLAAIGQAHGDLAVDEPGAVEAALRRWRPEVVFHAAAWTDVDGCEKDPERAVRVNGHGTALVAQACAEVGARLVYVSTDFVFDGRKHSPYGTEDPVQPISTYGRSKRLGETAVLELARPGFWVVRTSWVFGPGGKNFPAAILARARSDQPIAVVEDEVGSPTMTRDLAAALLDLAASDAAAGIYHACNEGVCSRWQFARQILAAAGLGHLEVGKLSAAQLTRPAKRPAYSALDCQRLTLVRGQPLPRYEDALARYLAEEHTA